LVYPECHAAVDARRRDQHDLGKVSIHGAKVSSGPDTPDLPTRVDRLMRHGLEIVVP
jgi:hypothetical protein